MAGAVVDISVDDEAVRRGLQQLLGAGVRLEPFFEQVGEHVTESWIRRFLTQASPDGVPWAPLDPDYAASKRAETGSELILVLQAHLKDGLRYQASNDGVEIGTDRPYGATHQFGDPERNIPARPYLGLSVDDRADIRDILQDHINRTLRR